MQVDGIGWYDQYFRSIHYATLLSTSSDIIILFLASNFSLASTALKGFLSVVCLTETYFIPCNFLLLPIILFILIRS